MGDPFPSALPDAPVTAYLFRSGPKLAATLDRSGASLPSDRAWHFEVAFVLSVNLPVPFAVDPEPILRGVLARGYYEWNARAPATIKNSH